MLILLQQHIKMFGIHKKSKYKRDNIYITFFGYKKYDINKFYNTKKNIFIEMLNVLYFSN